MVSILKRNCITHLRQKKRTFKIMMMNLTFLKKLSFPAILFIGSYNII